MLNKHDTFNGCIQNAISIKLKQKLFQKYKIFTKSKIVPKIASCIDNEQIEIDSIKKKNLFYAQSNHCTQSFGETHDEDKQNQKSNFKIILYTQSIQHPLQDEAFPMYHW